jgi:hypothetical protein
MSKIGAGTRQKPSPLSSLREAKGRRFGWSPPSQALLLSLVQQHPFDLDLTLALPTSIDLRASCPPVYVQGTFNSCTANAVAGLIEVLRTEQALMPGTPSRLFIYWFERVDANQQDSDNGGSVAGAIKAVIEKGYCFEPMWPYTSTNLLVPPAQSAIQDAANRSAQLPVSLNGLGQIKASLANRRPVAIGLTIYNSFFQADKNRGIVSLPDQIGPSEGHAGLLVGYDDTTGYLTMRNSWGTQNTDGTPCGDGGYYYLPYGYITNSLSADYWTIMIVGG